MEVSLNARPRASLGRVLDDLGSTILELVYGDPERGDDIGNVVIHDPVDESDLQHRALVLGVGLSDPDEIARLLVRLGQRQAAALVVRAPVPAGEAIAAAAAASGVAVVALTQGASWVQVTALLRSLLAVDSVGAAEAESLGGLPAGDLFALANAIAALLDAPITIEDRGSRVLAYSARQDEADPPRIATILGRQVPEHYTRMFRERGVFQQLYRSERPMWINPATSESDDVLPRVAVAVRAGDEVLGSIWVAVREPLSAERTQALSSAAKVVALHLLHSRAGADVKRRLHADLMSTALMGGAGAREALSRLGLTGQAVAVLALALVEGDDGAPAADAELATERQRLGDAFAMHLGAIHPRCAAALIGDVAYGLVPVSGDGDHGEQSALRIAGEFLRRVGHRGRAIIGVGPVARDAAGLRHARTTADRVLRVLRSRRGGGHLAARLADVHVEALMLELRDLIGARGDRATGPVARLLDYDARHNGRLVETLRAWLDSFGDVTEAAAALCVHPNTFRYRLRRLSAIGGIDLTDPESRFAAMVQLRVMGELG